MVYDLDVESTCVCVYVCVCFFFFQAEDGIRDLVRSRGLGDVYKRQVVVGVGADFLSNWGSTNENVWQYAQRRKPESATKDLPMSRHWQFEARMSLTGANADQRTAVRNSMLPPVSYTHLTLPTSDLV